MSAEQIQELALNLGRLQLHIRFAAPAPTGAFAGAEPAAEEEPQPEQGPGAQEEPEAAQEEAAEADFVGVPREFDPAVERNLGWQARLRSAILSGRQARRLLANQTGGPAVPRAPAPSPSVWVVLKDLNGVIHNPVIVGRWGELQDQVLLPASDQQAGRRQFGRGSVCHGWASQREAKAYVWAAGLRWP